MIMPSNDHRFPDRCLDGGALVVRKTLRTFVKALGEQAKTQAAADAYSEPPRAKYRKDRSHGKQGLLSPTYFGEGGEFLRHCYFEFFGRSHNLEGVWSLNASHGSIPEDLGWDGGAVSIGRGDPIYIQDKTTGKHASRHEMNDGSRVMNFVGSAAMHAIASERDGNGTVATNARFILWTTAKGVHRTLERRMHGMVEVVGCERISRDVDGVEGFWDFVSGKLVRNCGG